MSDADYAQSYDYLLWLREDLIFIAAFARTAGLGTLVRAASSLVSTPAREPGSRRAQSALNALLSRIFAETSAGR